MGASVVTKPTLEPVSVAEARAHLRLDAYESDGVLADYISAARQWAEVYTRRAFISQSWDVTFDGWASELPLPLAPVASITSVTYYDTAGVLQTLASTQYQTVSLTDFPAIVPAYDVTWPDLRDRREAVTVRFVAGYGATSDAVPQPIRTAILLHVESLYDRNPTSRELLEGTRDALLQPYCVVRV